MKEKRRRKDMSVIKKDELKNFINLLENGQIKEVEEGLKKAYKQNFTDTPRTAQKELPLEDIKKMYVEEKLTMLEIARRLDVTPPTIKKRLEQSGIQIRPTSFYLTPSKKGKLKIDISVDELKRLYYDEGLSCGAIGNMYGVSNVTINNYLKRADLARRKKNYKKPYYLNYGDHKIGNWHCANCDGIINNGDNYCKHCGYPQDFESENITAEEKVYEILCVGCEKEKQCHELCEHCEDYKEKCL